MIRALHVIPSLSPDEGGPSVALPAIVDALRQAGVEVTVATTRPKSDEPAPPPDTPIESDGEATYYSFPRTIEPYKASRLLGLWLRQHVHRFDVVHIHALFSYSSSVAARAAKRAQVPYIVRPLGVLNRWGMQNRRPGLKRLSLLWIENPILRGAAAIHFTSRQEQDEAYDASSAIRSARSVVIPLPVGISSNQSAQRDQFLGSFPKAAGRVIVLFLSRISKKKGLELLLAAFSAVWPTHQSALLVIAGSGEKEYERQLREDAKKLGIAEQLLWTGFLGGEDKAGAFAAATIFVLPSYSENFGIAAAEALAAGVPSILSDRVALSEYMLGRESAVIVPADSKAIGAALRLLLDDAPLRQRLSENGQQLARERFSMQAIGAALKDVYESVITKRIRDTTGTMT
jgi:glycosyltransferase involved in cell wall biosynthesis